MTLYELFPREQFPLRARTKIQTPDGSATAEIEVFYRYPFVGTENHSERAFL